MTGSVMKRAIAGVVISSFVVGLVAIFGSDADAQQRRRRRRQQRRANVTPHSDAIRGALGDVEWGWDRRRLVKYFTNKLREDYRPRIHKAGGAIEEDRLIHERDQKIRQLRKNFVRFNGRTTGYDSGFLRDEFTHRNNETMLRVRSDNADDYYFFIRGRLWKWYRAFDASVFAGADWEQFSAALQGRFGRARQRQGALVEGGEDRQWLEWQDNESRARAIDNRTFYGFYCLVFESKETLANLDTLRTNPSRRRDRTHSLVQAVTADGEGGDDAHADIVDRITGNRRRTDNGGSMAPRGGSPPPRRDDDDRGSSDDSGGSGGGGNDPLEGFDEF